MRSDIEAGLLAGEAGAGEQWELAAAVHALCSRLANRVDVPALAQIRHACRGLNAARQFELCRLLAQACHDAFPPDMAIVRHLLQAQINLSMLGPAQALLDRTAPAWAALPDSAGKRKEQLELDGLAARILKQRFVDDQEPDLLEAAYRAYLRAYEQQDRRPFWHGVNAVALQARAERDGLRLDGRPCASLAAVLYEQLAARDDSDPWRLATLSELCMALDRCDEAELWLYRMLHAPQTTAFMLDSYDRQLREIWQGQALQGERRCADRLASILARHQITRLATWSITPARARELRRADLEKVFSEVSSFSVAMIRRMLDACQSIGCVSSRNGARLGTGFVLDAADIGGAHSGRLFVTNAHVLSDTVAGAVPISEALVSFELGPDADGKPQYYAVAELVFSSGPGPLGTSCPAADLLDVTIVRLEAVPACVTGLRIARALPLFDGKAKAYVIGHPRGSGLQVSVHDSELLACDEYQRLIHYRTPTDPGSSGSPVFNEQWQIIALHHGGSHQMPRLKPAAGTYQANEGVTLSAIRAGLAAASR